MTIAAACLGAALGLLAPMHGHAAIFGLVAQDAAGEAGEARFKQAVADLKARRFAAAAAEFEALGREGRSVSALSLAAQARDGAGHRAHALEHIKALLAADPEMEARARGRWTARMAAIRRGTAPLLLRVQPEVAGARVSLQWVAADDPRPAIELSAEDGKVVDVDPGVWSVVVAADGHAPVQRVLTVQPRGRGEAVAVELTFALAPLERTVVLVLGPEAAIAAGAQWTLTHEGPDGVDGLQMIGGVEGRRELSLAPGRWRATAAATGYVPQEITFVVGEEEPPAVTLSVEAPPVVTAKPRGAARRVPDPGFGLGLGLGLGGAASFATGVGLLVRHRESYGHFVRAPDNAGFVRALVGSAAGSGMIGAGVGLAVAGVLAAVPVHAGPGPGRSGVGNRGLWATLGAGGGVVLIGAAWYAREWQRVQRDLYGEGDLGMASPDVQAQRRETAAAAFIGAGVGLATGAGVALLTRHLVRRSARKPGRVGLGAGPGLVGLGVLGRF